jgi:KaiC/GvpD/RAD55 family RecA-like ATPase
LVSTGFLELDQLLVDTGGYPNRSTILVVGPAGIGKEALGYWFFHAGHEANDFCLYITTLAVEEVLEDQRGFGIRNGWGSSGTAAAQQSSSSSSPSSSSFYWIAQQGGQSKCDLNDLPGLSATIKGLLRENSTRRIRIVTDILSPLLMLYPPETVYKFLSQLFTELKQYDTVFLATLEYEMHQAQAVAAMEQRFDGVIELKLYEKGIRVIPLFRIRKMRGLAPHPDYYRFSFVDGKMEIRKYAK